jgi:two-component system response regulator MprA
MAKILVVDDDKHITAFLRRGLSLGGHQVIELNSGAQAAELVMVEGPDLVVLDVLMPDVDGFEVCRLIRASSQVPILMLTARDEVADRVQGLTLGADDYLVKPFALEELLARVGALLRRAGSQAQTTNVLSFGPIAVDQETREVRRGERAITLTQKEYALLICFLQHPRQVLTRDYLMDVIWGTDYAGESNVLEVYVGYLRQKLEAEGEPRLLHTVRGVGYVLKEA